MGRYYFLGRFFFTSCKKQRGNSTGKSKSGRGGRGRNKMLFKWVRRARENFNAKVQRVLCGLAFEPLIP
jgi:hypothetical protein